MIEITPKMAKIAGEFHAEIKEKIKDFGLVDSIIYIVAKEMNAKIITGDSHFKNFKEAILIK